MSEVTAESTVCETPIDRQNAARDTITTVASCTMRKWPCRHKLLHNWALCQQTMSNIVNPVARGTGHCRRGSGLQTTKTMLCTRQRGSPRWGSGTGGAGPPAPRPPVRSSRLFQLLHRCVVVSSTSSQHLGVCHAQFPQTPTYGP